MRRLIGIGYRARSGKDTTAEYLRDRHGFTVWHFNDALYEQARLAQVVYVEGPEGVSLSVNGRPLVGLPGPSMDLIGEWARTTGVLLARGNGTSTWGYWGMREKDRRLLQWFGTDYRRRVDGEDYWLGILDRRLEKEDPDSVVIADVRFRNEAEWVIRHGGAMWLIDRPGLSEDQHISERELADWDGWSWAIDNDGGIEWLLHQAEEGLRSLGWIE